MNIVERVINWNIERNLDKQDYNFKREFGFIMEEMLEGLGFNQLFPSKIEFRANVNQNIELIIDSVIDQEKNIPVSSEQADAFGDIIVFAIGALMKICIKNPELGTPEELLERIMIANDAKGNKVDADGKIIKDKTFVEPVHTKDFNYVMFEIHKLLNSSDVEFSIQTPSDKEETIITIKR